jgi:hypothetical protein
MWGILVRLGRETSMYNFLCSGRTATDSTKSTPGYVTLNICFESGVICGSRCTFWCIRGAKC